MPNSISCIQLFKKPSGEYTRILSEYIFFYLNNHCYLNCILYSLMYTLFPSCTAHCPSNLWVAHHDATPSSGQTCNYPGHIIKPRLTKARGMVHGNHNTPTDTVFHNIKQLYSILHSNTHYCYICHKYYWHKLLNTWT